MSWATIVAFTLLFNLNGQHREVRGEIEVRPELYGTVCHRGLREYREELARIRGTLVSFECSETIIRK